MHLQQQQLAEIVEEFKHDVSKFKQDINKALKKFEQDISNALEKFEQDLCKRFNKFEHALKKIEETRAQTKQLDDDEEDKNFIEDDVRVVDFVFKDESFENRSRAKIGRNRVDEDFVQNLSNMLRAIFVQKRICEDSSYKQIGAKIMQNMLLKIRGRVFLEKRFGIRDHDQDSRTNLLQPGENDGENIWIYSKYHYYLLIG